MGKRSSHTLDAILSQHARSIVHDATVGAHSIASTGSAHTWREADKARSSKGRTRSREV